ncbi:hypothetical protein EUU23_07110 [Sphingorhabdus sp. IMCC26285]|jgi:hypothetical protein|uniref:Peptidase n=2 Tax=Sphingorhabdus profundilacus TaxID=2509718 RepID=A0A6I4LVU1_9SPHN|nr:hypothetical protein [Sphingorhabdus profundilacus]
MPGPDMAWGQGLDHVRIGLSEAGIAASDYPLLFMKDAESGQFRLVALFGLRPRVNFFLINGQWQATYLPIAVLGSPFHLGGSDQSLCIDEGSDLVTTDTGTALYSDDCSETSELLRIHSMFDYLRCDLDTANEFTATLVALNLLRPIEVTLEFSEGKNEMIEGLYSISPPRLSTLEDTAILDLHHRNFLDKIYIIMNSLGQMNRIQQLSHIHYDQDIIGLRTQMTSG